MGGLFSSTKATSKPVAVGALNIQQSCYGTPIQIIYGTNRASANLIWYGDFKSVLVSTGGVSGKGGLFSTGGGGGQQYEYYASFQFGLCEGPIYGVGTVWISKEITTVSGQGGTLFLGTSSQSAWGYLTTNHPTEADAYVNLAHVDFANYSLGTSAETPQFSFEVKGILAYSNAYAGQDALADEVISDFLTRSHFPSAYIGSFADARNYWLAMGFFISPVLDQQKQAMDWLKGWMETLNAEFVWSGGVLTIVPYADSSVTGNGATYTVDLTPEYDLTEDHFICGDDEDPVTIERSDLPDAYNRMPIEYVNRANQYNVETFTAEDPAHIDQYGVRTGSTIAAHHITDANIAQKMAYLKLWRSTYIERGNVYKFKLPWTFIRLDPMDLVTLTDDGLGLDHKLVRIKTISEDEDGVLSFEAEDMPGQIALPALYSTQETTRYTANYNVDPGFVNPPIIFETPLALVQSSSVELAIAVSGGDDWNGCYVWVSTDDTTYQNIGEINSKARQGVLTASLPTFSSASIDSTNTLSIDMSQSNGSFNNAATNQDALLFNTLCYVDGELIAYGNDSLTALNQYDLTYLNRGCYGSSISGHDVNSKFARFDAAVLRYAIDQSRIGQTLYFKFQSYNLYKSAPQQLADLSPYTYVVTGAALLTALDDPTDLLFVYKDKIAQINWSPVSDIRSPILYEIRKGTTFTAAQFLGETANVNFPVYGNGDYWVTAYFVTPTGTRVYSANPQSITISTPNLEENVVDTWDENSTGWSGTLVDCSVSSGNLLTDVGVLSASYTIPTGHRIASNYICNARVNVNWDSAAVSVDSDIVSITDITAIPDITFGSQQEFIKVQPQIRLSQDAGANWSDWQNWVAGVYTFNLIELRLVITIANTDYQASISTFNFSVDVDLLNQSSTVTTSSSAPVTVTFTNEYNDTPHINPTILDAQDGDTVVVSGISTSGFSVEVLNGGSLVVRNLSWAVTGW